MNASIKTGTIRDIKRTLHDVPDMSHKAVGELHGVSRQMVSAIAYGAAYADVKMRRSDYKKAVPHRTKAEAEPERTRTGRTAPVFVGPVEEPKRRNKKARKYPTDDDVRAIQKRLSEGATQKAVAVEFDVSASLVSRIHTGRRTPKADVVADIPCLAEAARVLVEAWEEYASDDSSRNGFRVDRAAVVLRGIIGSD